MLRSLSRNFKLIIDDLYRHHGRLFSTSFPGGRGRLEGKVALITGGASGLGKATANEFVQNGAHVIIADIDQKLGSEAAMELGSRAHYVYCDIGVESTVAEAVDAAVSRHGKLDIMYNNAGIAGNPIQPDIAELDIDEFDNIMRVNVRGTMIGIKHAARVMVPVCWGSILCTSSISGIMGGLGSHPYSISKHTIAGMVKSVASELCKSGVRINCISPGPVPTPLVVQQLSLIYRGANEKQIVENVNKMANVLKGAKCEERDVAMAALYLASDEAKYITGHNLVVDGGFTVFKNVM